MRRRIRVSPRDASGWREFWRVRGEHELGLLLTAADKIEAWFNAVRAE